MKVGYVLTLQYVNLISVVTSKGYHKYDKMTGFVSRYHL